MIFYVEEKFYPKTYDVDYAGIVNNQVYIRWLEDLRFLMMKKYKISESLPENVYPVIVKTEINYKKYVKLFEELKGRMWMTGIRGAKFFLKGEFLRENIVVADALQVGAFVEITKGKPVRIPDEIKKIFE